MKPELYEKLSAKIRELVPELMEGSFGHPITLEHVLEANDRLNISLESYGSKHYWNNQDEVVDKWEYRKPLSDQSDQLGELLEELLF